MDKIRYEMDPIIFPDKESVRQILESKIPFIAEENCFKLCNFCGPFWTHADGCKIAIQLFEKLHPEYVRMDRFNEKLASFRCGAGFMHTESKSAITFLSTISEKEKNGFFRRVYEAFDRMYGE